MGKPQKPFANRGPVQVTSISTAITPAATDAGDTPPIGWIQVIGAGSGALTVKDELGVSRAYTGLIAGQTLYGPFTEITSMSLSKILYGDGKAPEYPAGGAINQLYANAQTSQAQINVPLSGGILAAGTPMAAWANNSSSNPGITIADSKCYAIRWNDNATQTAVFFGVALPQDLDDTAPIVIHALVSVEATDDSPTLTITAFFQTTAALHDADTDCGGTSSAYTGGTAKQVQELTLTIAASDVPAAPCGLTFSVKPTNGTLSTATNDAVMSGLWIEYTRKLLST